MELISHELKLRGLVGELNRSKAFREAWANGVARQLGEGYTLRTAECGYDMTMQICVTAPNGRKYVDELPFEDVGVSWTEGLGNFLLRARAFFGLLRPRYRFRRKGRGPTRPWVKRERKTK